MCRTYTASVKNVNKIDCVIQSKIAYVIRMSFSSLVFISIKLCVFFYCRWANRTAENDRKHLYIHLMCKLIKCDFCFFFSFCSSPFSLFTHFVQHKPLLSVRRLHHAISHSTQMMSYLLKFLSWRKKSNNGILKRIFFFTTNVFSCMTLKYFLRSSLSNLTWTCLFFSLVFFAVWKCMVVCA